MGVTVHAQTGERIFTYDAAGNVEPNAKFIAPIEPITWPTTWVDEATQTIYSSDKACRYDIRLRKQVEAEGMKLFEAMVLQHRCPMDHHHHSEPGQSYRGVPPAG